jgi:hypothetical protein
MPTVNIPSKVRFALYLVSAIGSAVAAYLFAKGYVGDAELGLWAAVVAIVNTLSAANTNISGEPVVKVHDAVVEGDLGDERGESVLVVALVVVVIILLLAALGAFR